MSNIFSNRRVRQLLALFLAAIILFGLYTDSTGLTLSAEDTSRAYVLLDGEKVDEVTLIEDEKLRLEAASEETASAYGWQIRDPKNSERWINISDGYSRYLWLTHALVGSMLTESGTAYLRCKLQIGEEEVFTEPVTVTLSLNVPDPETAPEDEIRMVTVEGPVLGAGETSEGSDSTEGNFKTYSIVINYLYDDNTMAFEPYGASVAAGSNFKATIPSPSVVGYDPYRREGEKYIDAKTVVFDLTNIRENVTVNVIYEPALVNVTVHHHLQHLEDDEYSVSYDLITYSKAITGTIVGDGLALTEAELPGFHALAYEKLEVAADGSTVIEIRYDRNYYLVDFNMSGGYGTEPIYTRYGASVGANDPIRHGYVFDGWELVAYGGASPTMEQKSAYALQNGTTIILPAANLSYKARWITQETTYTMVFWCENADDNGYSYWGYLDNLPALSGSYVDGRDLISQVAGISDEQYFTFNASKTDRNVLVEGDGSTVVNVYYTRNYYTITFKATGKCVIPEKHTHTDDCYEDICGQAHVHTEDCALVLQCPLTEHTAHTDACLICGYEEHVHGSVGCDCDKEEHAHTINCWNNVGSNKQTPYKAPSNPEQGEIYKRGTTYYIYISGAWYKYTGYGVSNGDIVDPSCRKDPHTHGTDCDCDKTPHTHSTRCYRDTLHTHNSDCYAHSCGKETHTHTNGCNRVICPTPAGHTHNDNCDSSSRTNTVKIVYAKYGQTLNTPQSQLWPVTDGNGKTYNSGERWQPSNSSYYNAVLVYIAQMPPDDFTLTLNTANYKKFTMNYYLQDLDGNGYTLDNTIVANYNHITKAEDFFDIRGFTQASSDPKFNNSGKIETSASALTVNFYYNRSTYQLEFNNNGTVLDDKKKTGVMYNAPLAEFNFTPAYPSNLEPNAYTFAGWYTSPGCFDGTEVDWETLTMPDGDLMLYAKWAPVTHTVRVFKDSSLDTQIGTAQTVEHKAFATAPTGQVVNGNLIFQGWFYKEEVNGVKVEKAFMFQGIPIVKDMKIYAKWSSHVSVNYTIRYKTVINGQEIEIADPTTGTTIAGQNKTFDAKAGTQLYPDYQVGYYPVTNSHTITMTADGTHEFTFYYVFVESMPYLVRYVDSETGMPILVDKEVRNNNLSVVTETFQRINGMMPDAYQKRLVLSAKGTDANNDGILDSNVITFYYNSDSTHAYYRVVHYIQNVSGDSYREYRSEETVGEIGKTYTVSALTLTGFAYKPDKTVIDSVVKPSTGTEVSTQLSADGALIELYYDRLLYEYTVRYIDNATQQDIIAPKTGSALFGAQVLEYARNLSDLGYTLVGDTSAKLLNVSANRDYNVIEFFYQEKTVALKYAIVGPEGCGALSQDSENLTAITGTPNGSAPIVNNGFLFLGWYKDSACTIPVDSAWVEAHTNRILPQKTGDIWNATTYYAKFAALETDLTITTTSTYAKDANQVFLFRIQGKPGTETAHIDLTVSIVGNGSVTVTKLPTGDYTVTELTDWSWRYENGSAARDVTLNYNGGNNRIIYDNSRENGFWLDGNAVKDNAFSN